MHACVRVFSIKIEGTIWFSRSSCVDCLVHFCCEACALGQEYRELKNLGFDIGIGNFFIVFIRSKKIQKQEKEKRYLWKVTTRHFLGSLSLICVEGVLVVRVLQLKGKKKKKKDWFE